MGKVFNLVRQPELRVGTNGTPWTILAVAQNKTVKESDGSYRSVSPIYWNIRLFGAEAESICKSNLPLGTPLLIDFDLDIDENRAYTSKDGVEHPASVSPGIRVRSIGVALGRGITVDFKREKAGSKQEPTQVAPKVADSKPAQAPKQPKPASNLFEDDLFATPSTSATTSSNQSVDGLFDDEDLFN